MSDRLAIEQQDAIGEVVRWLELFWRQRWLVLAVTSAVFLLGTVYVLTRASQYEVITLIDIGLRDAGRDSSGRQIETTDASLGRFSQVYLPQLRRERRTARKAPTIAITASAARGASILQLRSLATTSMIPEHIAMQQAGAAFLLAEHGSQFAALRAAMEREIKSLEAELLTVQELEPLQVELTRLEKEAPAAKSKLDATAAGDPARPALAATQVALELRLRELQAAVASMTRKNELFEAERALKRQRVAQIRNRLSATRAAATAKSPANQTSPDARHR